MMQHNNHDAHSQSTTLPPRRRQGWKRKLAALGFGLVVAFLTGEIALRIGGYSPEFVNALATFHTYDSELGFIGRAGFEGNFHTPEFEIKLRYSDEGFREIGAANPGARRTLYVLGDSFAWGWGVEDRATLCDRIAKDHPGWNVRNYALPGYGTLQQQRVFERFVRPNLSDRDAVLIVHYGNDFDDSLGKHLTNVPRAVVSREGEIEVLPPPPDSWTKELKNRIKQHSYLCNFVAYTTDFLKYSSRQQRFLDRQQQEAVPAEVVAPLDPGDPRRIVMREYLSRIKTACDQQRVPLLMARIPFREEYGEARPVEAEKNEPFAAYRPSLHAIAAELEIPLHDLHDSFQQWKSHNEGRLTFPVDLHWNATGHELAADSMRGFLSAHLPQPLRPAVESASKPVTRQ
jgi:lysophospholipase L1-like esterase